MRRTKIVCTIGPASEGEDVIEALLAAGMNVARLNASHLSPEELGARIQRLRAVAARLGRPLAIMVDLQGPKLRIGEVPGGRRMLAAGDRLVLTSGEPAGDEIHVPYPPLARDLRPGWPVFIDDGLIELQVEAVEPPRVICRVVLGGELQSRKGLTLPGVRLDLPAVPEQDEPYIRLAVEHDVDFLAASFVRRAAHVQAVRAAAEAAGRPVPVIAKIESQEAIENLEEIVAAADGVMVARGDLGVEIPPEDVPLVQKAVIDRCNRAGKPVITATQMLDSMVRNARPTRAEVTDVANAIFDGTDAVMLSAETAVGRFPVQAVQMMDRIARRSEAALDDKLLLKRRREVGRSVAEAIAYATCVTAEELSLAAILCWTQSGATARLVAKFRPRCPILALTPDPRVARQLALVWGVHPIEVRRAETVDQRLDVALEAALAAGLVQKGDSVAFAAGVRTGTPGSTNLLQVLEV